MGYGRAERADVTERTERNSFPAIQTIGVSDAKAVIPLHWVQLCLQLTFVFQPTRVNRQRPVRFPLHDDVVSNLLTIAERFGFLCAELFAPLGVSRGVVPCFAAATYVRRY